MYTTYLHILYLIENFKKGLNVIKLERLYTKDILFQFINYTAVYGVEYIYNIKRALLGTLRS